MNSVTSAMLEAVVQTARAERERDEALEVQKSTRIANQRLVKSLDVLHEELDAAGAQAETLKRNLDRCVDALNWIKAYTKERSVMYKAMDATGKLEET